jgi:hypothetical protein
MRIKKRTNVLEMKKDYSKGIIAQNIVQINLDIYHILQTKIYQKVKNGTFNMTDEEIKRRIKWLWLYYIPAPKIGAEGKGE